MYSVSFIYSNLSLHCFPFLSFQGKFFFPRSMAFFTITTVNDCVFHQTYQFTYCSQVWQILWIAVNIGNSISSLCISPFGGWQGCSCPWGGIPEQEWNMDRHPSSIICPQQAAREGECSRNDPIYIRPPPKPPKIRGCYTDIFPHRRRRGVGARAHAWVIPDWGVGVGGVSLERIRCDTGTVTPHRKHKIYYMRNIPDARRPPKNTVRSWYVLGWCLYQDKPYGTIILTEILFRAYNDNNKV